jgi:hypothetical protein
VGLAPGQVGVLAVGTTWKTLRTGAACPVG